MYIYSLFFKQHSSRLVYNSLGGGARLSVIFYVALSSHESTNKPLIQLTLSKNSHNQSYIYVYALVIINAYR